LDVKLNDSHLDEVRAALKNWDYQAQAASAPAALYESFWKHLLADTFNDDLPKKYQPSGGDRWFEVVRNIAKDSNSQWWDNKTTKDKVETRDDIFAQAFKEAVTELESTLGRDSTKWTWGALHTATFRNGTLGESGIGLIEDLFNRGPFAVSGGGSIVNATAWDATEGYDVTHVPSMRMIVDLGDLNNSLTVHTTGESGHAYNKHYDDMSQMWANIQYYSMLWDQKFIIRQAEGHLVLTPK
jgi:penicillin amidase